jgi:hypothetical protein
VCLFPIMLTRRIAPVEVYGLLDGVMALGSDGVDAETEIAIGPHHYRAFPDTLRSQAADFFAMRED